MRLNSSLVHGSHGCAVADDAILPPPFLLSAPEHGCAVADVAVLPPPPYDARANMIIQFDAYLTGSRSARWNAGYFV